MLSLDDGVAQLHVSQLNGPTDGNFTIASQGNFNLLLDSDNDLANGEFTIKESAGNNARFKVDEAGLVTVYGNIAADADESKTIFAESATSSNTITLGGGAKVISAGDHQVNGDIVADNNEAKAIFAAVTSNAITVGGGTSATLAASGKVKVGGDALQNSSGQDAITFDAAHSRQVSVADSLTVAGNVISGSAGAALQINPSLADSGAGDVKVLNDLTVTGNVISGSAGANLTLGSSGDVTVAGDLKVTGEGIQAADGNERISLADALVLKDASGDAVVTLHATDLSTTLAGPLTASGNVRVNGNQIRNSANVTALSFDSQDLSAQAGDVRVAGDLQVDGNALSGSGGLNLTFAGSGLVATAGKHKVGGDALQNSSGQDAITFDTNHSRQVSVADSLTVTGNVISGSAGANLTLGSSGDVTVAGDLKITGEGIQEASGNERISLADALVLKDATANAVVTLHASDLSTTLAGDLTVSGGDVTVGSDADGTDRKVVFGHTTLKSVMGIDDSQDVFAINTDDAFEDDNDFEIASNGNVTLENGSLTIGGNAIKNSSDQGVITFDTAHSRQVSVADSLTVTGNVISGSAGANLTLGSSGDVTVAGDLTVTGNDLDFGNGATVINTSNQLLTVTEANIKLAGNAIVDNHLQVAQDAHISGSSLFLKNSGGTAVAALRVGLPGSGGGSQAATDLMIGATTIAMSGAVQMAHGLHIDPADGGSAVLQFNGKVSMNATEGCLALTGSGQQAVGTDDSIAIILRTEPETGIQAGDLITFSDKRLKTDIAEIDDNKSLEMVMSMNPVSYKLKGNEYRTQIGFLAQEMAELYPEVCLKDKETGEGIGIDYSRLTSVLASALQAQQKQIEALKKSFVAIKK